MRSAGYHLAVAIQRAVAVGTGGSVYIAGGLDAAGITVGGVFALDPGTGNLRSLGSLPRISHDAAGAVIGSRLFVFGGGSSSGTDLVQTFDPATGTGAIAGHLPVALSDLSSATIGGTTYLVGGYDGTRPRSEIYATSTGAVTPSPPLTRPTADAAVASVSGGVLLIGGWGGRTLDQVLRADLHAAGTGPDAASPASLSTSPGEPVSTYGHAGIRGSAQGYLHKPDEFYPMPEGGVVMEDGSDAGQLSYPDGLDLLFPGNVTPLHVDVASQVVQAGRP